MSQLISNVVGDTKDSITETEGTFAWTDGTEIRLDDGQGVSAGDYDHEGSDTEETSDADSGADVLYEPEDVEEDEYEEDEVVRDSSSSYAQPNMRILNKSSEFKSIVTPIVPHHDIDVDEEIDNTYNLGPEIVVPVIEIMKGVNGSMVDTPSEDHEFGGTSNEIPEDITRNCKRKYT